LRKIPRGLNAISHLNDHFSKFGKITNIQIAYENDPEAAIVTFSSHAEANVAYRSTEAVLNNRFIKVFWHTGSNENNPMSGPTGSLPKPSELSVRRFPYQSTPAQNPQTPTEGSESAADGSENQANKPPPQATNNPNSFVSKASVAAQQERLKAVKLNQATKEMIRKKQKEQQNTAVQLAHGLYQKKQELLQKNLQQMKQLFDKLEKTDPLDPARTHLMETIKALQSIIDKMKQELETDSQQIVAKMHTQTPPQRKTKEQAQKELLDVELELISKEQHGDSDTYAIQKRYLELQKTLRAAGAPSGGPPQHFQPQPRPTVARFGSTSVDRRPTTIKITGFTLDESDSVLGHFKVNFN
jgi:RNA-binding protein 26